MGRVGLSIFCHRCGKRFVGGHVCCAGCGKPRRKTSVPPAPLPSPSRWNIAHLFRNLTLVGAFLCTLVGIGGEEPLCGAATVILLIFAMLAHTCGVKPCRPRPGTSR